MEGGDLSAEAGSHQEKQEQSEGLRSSPNGKVNELLITKTLDNLFFWLFPSGAFSLFAWLFAIFQTGEILQHTCWPQNLVNTPSNV